MPKVLEGSARELILNIKKFCEEEKKSKALLIPLKNVRARVAALAGISEKTVTRIVKEGKAAEATSSRLVTPGKKRPHPKRIVIDNVDLAFVRQKIHHYYVANKEMPSINKLKVELASEINYKGSNTTLRRILKSIGFKFKSPMKSAIPKLPTNKALKKEKSLKILKVKQEPPQQPLPPPEPNYSMYMREIPIQMAMAPLTHNVPQMHTLTIPTMSNMQNEPMLQIQNMEHQHQIRDLQML